MESVSNLQGEGAQEKREARIALRARLSSGEFAMPVDRVLQIVGFAELSGEADELFLGWLTYRGEQIPVFDLNQAVCEQSSPRTFGSRIAIVEAGRGASARPIGLLTPGLTDTVARGTEDAELLPLDMYCSILLPLIPEAPVEAA